MHITQLIYFQSNKYFKTFYKKKILFSEFRRKKRSWINIYKTWYQLSFKNKQTNKQQKRNAQTKHGHLYFLTNAKIFAHRKRKKERISEEIWWISVRRASPRAKAPPYRIFEFPFTILFFFTGPAIGRIPRYLG